MLLAWFESADNRFTPTHGSRFGVDHVWMVWLICVAMIPFLYYPCRAFARFKRTTSQKWPRYF